jgi:hypothetical protein
MSAPLAAGPFLPISEGLIEKHAKLPLEPKSVLGTRDRYVAELRTHRRGLAAARIRGDSMKDIRIFNGQIVVFQRWDFPSVTTGDLVLIERVATRAPGLELLSGLSSGSPQCPGGLRTAASSGRTIPS